MKILKQYADAFFSPTEHQIAQALVRKPLLYLHLGTSKWTATLPLGFFIILKWPTNDYSGKRLFLFFWLTYCIYQMLAFPEISSNGLFILFWLIIGLWTAAAYTFTAWSSLSFYYSDNSFLLDWVFDALDGLLQHSLHSAFSLCLSVCVHPRGNSRIGGIDCPGCHLIFRMLCCLNVLNS